MMRAAEIARERGIPYFGICYGFQWAAVEYARHVCGLADADSTECCARDAAQGDLQAARPARRRRPRRHDAARHVRVRAEAGLDSRSSSTAQTVIHERHRHRYEFNCLYEKTLTDKGLEIVGRSLDGKFVEIIELPDASVVRRGAVPPRVQVEAAQAASAVRGLRRGEPPAQGCAAGSEHAASVVG